MPIENVLRILNELRSHQLDADYDTLAIGVAGEAYQLVGEDLFAELYEHARAARDESLRSKIGRLLYGVGRYSDGYPGEFTRHFRDRIDQLAQLDFLDTSCVNGILTWTVTYRDELATTAVADLCIAVLTHRGQGIGPPMQRRASQCQKTIRRRAEIMEMVTAREIVIPESTLIEAVESGSVESRRLVGFGFDRRTLAKLRAATIATWWRGTEVSVNHEYDQRAMHRGCDIFAPGRTDLAILYTKWTGGLDRRYSLESVRLAT